MRRVKFTLKQINEVLDISVNPRQGEDIDTAMKRTKDETNRTVGSSVERNYVVSGDDASKVIGEENEEGANNGTDLLHMAVTIFFNNVDWDSEDYFITPDGRYNMDRIMDELSMIYEDLTDDNIYNDREKYLELKNIFKKEAIRRDNIKENTFTKEQVIESIKNKKYSSCERLTKDELLKKLM